MSSVVSTWLPFYQTALYIKYFDIYDLDIGLREQLELCIDTCIIEIWIIGPNIYKIFIILKYFRLVGIMPAVIAYKVYELLVTRAALQPAFLFENISNFNQINKFNLIYVKLFVIKYNRYTYKHIYK